MDTAEAGKLLAGSAARSPAAAAGAKLLPSQRPRLPSPPPAGGTAAAAGSSAAAGQSRLVAVELAVTPEQAVTVTLCVAQPPASQGRLPGLRRTGFGSALGGQRQLGAAVPGAVAAAVSGAAWNAAATVADAAAAVERKPRKPRKRVTWKSERELESVRWFVKEDPAVKVSAGGHSFVSVAAAAGAFGVLPGSAVRGGACPVTGCILQVLPPDVLTL